MGATGPTMQTLLHVLLGVLSLSVVMASSPPIIGGDWNMTLPTPPGRGSEEECEMLMTGPNPVPADELPWYCICHQCQGNRGTKGEKGDRGWPGMPGSPGRRGLTGPRGPPGFKGRDGIKGQKGDEGLKGEKGGDGPTGPQGTRGFKGDKGDRGGEGNPGDQGPKGNDGLCPASCEASQGPPGPQGLSGAAGPRGMPGITGSTGVKGTKGDTGNIGFAGAPGSVGEKGDQGVEGECDCNDGEPGSQGQKGDKGAQGGQGQTGPVGQKGSEGEKGDLGQPGFPGPPGPCMPDTQSSFSAQLSESFPPPGLPVVFSVISSRDGCAPECVPGAPTCVPGFCPQFCCRPQHYNRNSGIYIAPVNGTYVFTYHLTVFQRVLKVGLFRNSSPIVKSTSATPLGTTSQQVVLHLDSMDRVYLLVKNDLTNGMYAGPEMSSIFSGFLLYPDRCDQPISRDFLPPPAPPVDEYMWGGDDESTGTVAPTAGQ